MSEYPSDWEIANLSDLATIKASNVDKKTKEGQKEISLCNYMDVFKNPVVSSSLEFMRSTASEREISEFSLSKGDVLLTKDSEVPEEIGIPSVVTEDIPDLVCGYHLYMIRADHSRINPEYLCWALRSNSSRQYFYQMANGSTRFGLNLKHVEECSVAIPSLPEQKKIAVILSGIDLQIANQLNKASKCKHLLQGLLDQVMTRGTRGRMAVDTDAGKVPDNWRVGKVDDFFVLGRGRVISIPYIKDHPGPYPVFSSQSKNNGEMGRMDTYDFDGNYFTWTTDGAYAGSVFARNGKFNCTNVCGTGRAKLPSEADAKFAAYFLQRVAKKHVSYVGNPKLMNHIFAEIPFALPPIDEQREINSMIDAAKISIDLVEKQVASLSNLKSSISADLLSGRKRVSV